MNYRLLGTLAGFALCAVALSAPAPDINEDIFKDRANFIPLRKAPQPPKIIGVLVSDAGAVMARDGRQGSPASYAISSYGNNYCWLYVPSETKPQIADLRVRTGEKGDVVKLYHNLSVASPETVKQTFGFDVPYALVQVEANDGLGGPGDEGVVATKMKRLDGTTEFPLKVDEVIDRLRKKYDAWLKDQELSMNEAMAKAQAKSIKDEKATGPRTHSTIMYVTWMPESQKLSVRFLTRIADGAFQARTGADPDIRPNLPGGKGPVRPNFRTGTEFGVEFGMAYEVSRTGTIEKTLRLPVEAFEHKFLAPPGK